MPRNGSGTFAVLTPIQIAALRSSAVVNANFDDAGDELTNTLPIDGVAAMTGQLKLFEGAAIEPGTGFTTDLNTGFRRSAANEMKWVAGGVDRVTMDANGKMTLSNGIAVTGSVALSAILAPHNLSATGQPVSTLRRTENDTAEHELATYESGSGANAKGSLRVVGGGANDVQTMRFYVNDVKAFEWTQSLFTMALDVQGAAITARTAGLLDVTEITAPSSPAANIGRVYAKDTSGTTGLFYKDSAGTERPFLAANDRQVFTASSTWTKPNQGTMALIETWGGGGSGGKGVDATADNHAGGGGGGAYAFKLARLADLSAAVSVTVGAGGVAVTATNANGNVGGNSGFGAYVTAFGGGGGDSENKTATGGGGGGLLSAGSTFGQGGRPSTTDGGATVEAVLGADPWGTLGLLFDSPSSNPFGGAATSEGANGRQGGLYGGGGGGIHDKGTAAAGGFSVFAGAGGGASSSATPGAGGVSTLAGNGGAGGVDGATGGSIPAGGGGGNWRTGSSGAGARGEVRVTVW